MKVDRASYLEVGQVRNLERSHFLPVNLIASVFGVSAHGPAACALVEAFADLLGREREAAEGALKDGSRGDHDGSCLSDFGRCEEVDDSVRFGMLE